MENKTQLFCDFEHKSTFNLKKHLQNYCIYCSLMGASYSPNFVGEWRLCFFQYGVIQEMEAKSEWLEDSSEDVFLGGVWADSDQTGTGLVVVDWGLGSEKQDNVLPQTYI